MAVAAEDLIDAEVVYALPGEQTRLAVRVPRGTTIRAAIERSGLLQRHPDIDLDRSAVGVYGKRAVMSGIVRQGDRVEIYRPLVADPEASRRRRAAKRAVRR